MIGESDYQSLPGHLNVALKNIELKQKFIDYGRIRDTVYLKNLSLPGIFRKTSDSVTPFFNYPVYLELPWNINHLTFNFSAVDWNAPHKLVYSYMIEGLDQSWSIPASSTSADYRNIPFGNYYIKVKAANESGDWSEPFKYFFTIRPPWWQTWVARTCYLIVAILAVIAVIRWRTAKLLRRQKELEQVVKERTSEIVKQKEHIEEIHHDVSKSIEYAKRIQESIIPEPEILTLKYPEYFVLFRPRDVVSGDFYWWAQVDNYTIIAAADCTGHGVPGAFMSILGISSLREIVLKEQVKDPGLILGDLRREIIKSLRQRGEYGEQKDGMDLALVSIDNETGLLRFSGANNPLYIISKNPVKSESADIRILNSENSEFVLYEIRPDKMPIGIYQRMNDFSCHTIQTQKGDMIYMFSDGFADQFGGEMNKKFTYKSMKEVLLKNAHKAMNEQKELINKTYDDWKGDYMQIDDVVLVGVKI
jgi:serine phosphatase RsbU (regulator of sigma subunit)